MKKIKVNKLVGLSVRQLYCTNSMCMYFKRISIESNHCSEVKHSSILISWATPWWTEEHNISTLQCTQQHNVIHYILYHLILCHLQVWHYLEIITYNELNSIRHSIYGSIVNSTSNFHWININSYY